MSRLRVNPRQMRSGCQVLSPQTDTMIHSFARPGGLGAAAWSFSVHYEHHPFKPCWGLFTLLQRNSSGNPNRCETAGREQNEGSRKPRRHRKGRGTVPAQRGERTSGPGRRARGAAAPGLQLPASQRCPAFSSAAFPSPR